MTSEFAWLIEGPGSCYLAVQKAGGHWFHWTRDHNAAICFHTREQAEAVMMAVRELKPDLFPGTFGEPKPVAHGWLP